MKTQEEFTAAERMWRTQLTGRSLVIEANADVAEAKSALALLGQNFARYKDERRRRSLLRDYHAAFLVGTCAVAATTYDLGAFWPHFDKAFGATYSDDRRFVSEMFREGLESFELSRFTFPRKNVDEILMHAGIPGQRTDEFMLLLAKRDALVEGLDGRQFCQWVSGMSRATAYTYGLDAPTWRFLAEGREIAEDLVDRSLDLLDLWANNEITEADLASFPSVMHEDLLRALDEMTATPTSTRTTPRHSIELAPSLTFDQANGVRVSIPALEQVTESRVEWVVSSEGTTARYTAEAPWPGDPVSSRFHEVSRPVKHVSLTAHPSDNTWLVPVIDPDEPLLAFDASSGKWIPPRNTLPKSEVWVAVPNPDSLPALDLLEVDGNVDGAVEIESPLGWGLWSFVRLPLSNVSRFKQAGAERWRYVSTVSRPQIHSREPSPWVFSLDGAPVCAHPPMITVPGVPDTDHASVAITWTITVTRVSDNSKVHSQTVQSSSSPTEVHLDDGKFTSLVGVFEFKVTGPLGRGTSRRLAVAPGLEMDPSMTFRAMDTSGAGLTPARVHVNLPGWPGPREVRLEAEDVSSAIELGTAESSLPARVAIPCMSVTHAVASRAMMSFRPVQIDVEDLPSSSLRVALEAPGPVTLVAMKGAEVIQSVNATVNGKGVATFNIAQLADSLSTTGGATLLVGHDSLRVPVARVSPRQLVESIMYDGDSLRFVGLTTHQPLELAIHRRYAPWLAPLILKTAGEESIPLPWDLKLEQELRVVARIDDPWITHEWSSEYPSRAPNTFDLQVGELWDPVGPDRGFRTWLSRRGPCPEGMETLPIAVALYNGTALAKFRTPIAELRAELASSMAVSRAGIFGAVAAAATGVVPTAMYVASDVVTLPPGNYEPAGELWQSAPLLALLGHDWGGELAGPVRDDLVTVFGESAAQILESGVDPYSTVGRFDSTIEIISRMPVDRIDEIWRTVESIPERSLDDKARQIAAKQLFDGRMRAGGKFAQYEAALPSVKRVLESAFGTSAFEPVRNRCAKPGWTNLPAFTIAFSLVARAAARDVPNAILLHDVTKHFLLSLAHIAPAIVEQDVALAELWITRWSKQ